MRFSLLLGFLLATFTSTALAADLKYWIEPCVQASLVAKRPSSGCKADDPQLAEWAVQAWQKAAGGKLHLEKSATSARANIRIHWATAEDGQYGETRPFYDGSIKGAEVYVRPDLSAMGPEIADVARKDELLRDAIVYLTCLHETGHALGLQHTADFPDIMYSFQFGGDIPEYFNRYRRQLKSRKDIADHTGISPQDQARLLKVIQ
ncbi:MAG: matrixin family metalloprotease [Acidobacteriota bacterium]